MHTGPSPYHPEMMGLISLAPPYQHTEHHPHGPIIRGELGRPLFAMGTRFKRCHRFTPSICSVAHRSGASEWLPIH